MLCFFEVLWYEVCFFYKDNFNINNNSITKEHQTWGSFDEWLQLIADELDMHEHQTCGSFDERLRLIADELDMHDVKCRHYFRWTSTCGKL